MKRSRAEIAEIKWLMLDTWLQYPEISNDQMAKRFAVDNHTVAKYKAQWLEIFDKWQNIVEKKVVEQVEQKTGLWRQAWDLMTGRK